MKKNSRSHSLILNIGDENPLKRSRNKYTKEGSDLILRPLPKIVHINNNLVKSEIYETYNPNELVHLPKILNTPNYLKEHNIFSSKNKPNNLFRSLSPFQTNKPIENIPVNNKLSRLNSPLKIKSPKRHASPKLFSNIYVSTLLLILVRQKN